MEHRRTTGFLLGLIFVLALLFVGFEYTSQPADINDKEDLLDETQQDLEMMPPMDTKDMVSVESSAPASKSITNNIKKVENTTDNLNKLSPSINPDQQNEGQGEGQGTAEDDGKAQQNITEAQEQTPPQDPSDNPFNFRVVEKLPLFPGGWVEFMKFLNKNIKYPPLAQSRKIQGKVVVSFIVNKDGTCSGIKVNQSVDPLLDREAVRVLRMMPKWTPGEEKGKVCRTMIAIPINFQL